MIKCIYIILQIKSSVKIGIKYGEKLLRATRGEMYHLSDNWKQSKIFKDILRLGVTLFMNKKLTQNC